QEKIDFIDQVAKKQTEIEAEIEVEEADFFNEISSPVMDAEKLKLMADLEEGKKLTNSQQEKIKDLLEKEKMILYKEREADIILRKSQIESAQKETLFKRELEKATKI